MSFEPLQPGDDRYNTGIQCDVKTGPCACGSWHEPRIQAEPDPDHFWYASGMWTGGLFQLASSEEAQRAIGDGLSVLWATPREVRDLGFWFATWDDVQLTSADLDRLVQKYPPPQSWYDEDIDGVL